MKSLSNVLETMGDLNLFVIGIAVILAYLLISGLRRGLKKRGDEEDSKDTREDDSGDAP